MAGQCGWGQASPHCRFSFTCRVLICLDFIDLLPKIKRSIRSCICFCKTIILRYYRNKNKRPCFPSKNIPSGLFQLRSYFSGNAILPGCAWTNGVLSVPNELTLPRRKSSAMMWTFLWKAKRSGEENNQFILFSHSTGNS